MAPSKQVRIALTFDDGPHTASKAAGNYTLKINKVLTDNQIQAAFFVQAQTPIRMGNQIGMDIVRTLYTSGHSIQIHTGSKEDHALYYNRVAQEAYDINGDKKINELDGDNGLQSDMKYAKKAIADAIRQTKGNPEYVPLYARAPTGALYPSRATPEKAAALRKQILEALAKEGLSNVLWNVDSCDNADPTPSRARSSNILTPMLA